MQNKSKISRLSLKLGLYIVYHYIYLYTCCMNQHAVCACAMTPHLSLCMPSHTLSLIVDTLYFVIKFLQFIFDVAVCDCAVALLPIACLLRIDTGVIIKLFSYILHSQTFIFEEIRFQDVDSGVLPIVEFSLKWCHLFLKQIKSFKTYTICTNVYMHMYTFVNILVVVKLYYGACYIVYMYNIPWHCCCSVWPPLTSKRTRVKMALSIFVTLFVEHKTLQLYMYMYSCMSIDWAISKDM